MIVREDQPGDQRLVAYVVRRPSRRRSADAARRRWPDRCREYMVPSAFVVAGRAAADRQRQARPQGAARARARRPTGAGRAPRTPREEVLCGAVRRRARRAEQVGIDDDFFDLGGHSLLATRLVSRVRAALGVELPIRDAVRGPDRRRAGRPAGLGAGGTAAARCAPMPRPERLPLSFAQQRLWFLHRLEGPRHLQHPLVLRLSGALDLDALRAAVDDVVAAARERCARCSPRRRHSPYQVVADAPSRHARVSHTDA